MATYASIYDGPPAGYTRTRTRKLYIAIHSTANDATAEQEASYAKRRTDSTSSHYYVDSNSIVQSLDTDFRAWHAGSQQGNDHAIAYEITGVNGWTRRQWLDRVAWGLLAAQIRRDCAKHGITPRHLSVAQIRAGRMTGFITHNDMRLAWGGTTHTDPGPNWPMDHLIRLVTEEDDMAWTERIKTSSYVQQHFGIEDMQAGIALTSTYGHIRRARQEGREQHQEQMARLAAIEASVGGSDVEDAVRSELARSRQIEAAERQAELGELEQLLHLASVERGELAELVRQGQSGELSAAEVVDELGRRLAAAGGEPVPAGDDQA